MSGECDKIGCRKISGIERYCFDHIGNGLMEIPFLVRMMLQGR